MDGKGRRDQCERNLFQTFTIREGVIVRIDEYTERAQALKAARLSE